MWDIERRKELEMFQILLRETSRLNESSSIIERLEKCIKISKNLTKSNTADLKESFINYVTGIALKTDDSKK